MTASFDQVDPERSLTAIINESDSASIFDHALAELYRTPINLSDAKVELVAGEEPVYTGSALTPAVVVTLGGAEVPVCAYDVAYDNNVNATTDEAPATVTVTAKDGSGYVGSASGTFSIGKARKTGVSRMTQTPYGKTGRYDVANVSPLPEGWWIDGVEVSDPDGAIASVAVDGTEAVYTLVDDMTLVGASATLTVAVSNANYTADVKVAMIVGDRKESAAGRLATWNNIAQTGEGTYADTTEDGIGLFIGSDGITITNSSGRDLPTSQFMLTMAASGIVYTYDLDAIPAGGSASIGLELTDFDFIDAMLVEAAPAGSVTVTFNMMHYGSQVAPITVAKGETITLPDPSSFAELGYVFQGWTIDAEKTVAFDPSQPIEEDMTLYASWDQDPAYFPPSGDALGFWQANTNDEDGFLFWQPDGSRVGTTADGIELRIDSNTATITNNSASDLPPTTLLLWTPKKWWVPNDKGSGIIFLNFDALPVGSNASGSFTMPGTDWVMRAHLYGAPSVTVTFDMNGHGTQVDPITVAKGGTITLPAPDSFAEQGWDFGGWTVDTQNTLDFDPSQTIEKDTTLYARWTEAVEYATVTFESALGTAPDPVTVERGGTVELPVLAGDEDNVFAGWVVKGSEVADPFKGEYVAEGDATLVAVWVASEPGTPDGPADNPSDKPGDGGNGNGSGATKPSGSNGSASQGAGAPAIPKTGDDQGAPLAPLFLGGAALAASGVAVCAYRRRPAR